MGMETSQAAGWLMVLAAAGAGLWTQAADVSAADVAVWFRNSGVHTVRLDADAAVDSLFVGGSDAGGSPDLTLNLGGRTLTATNAVRCGWAWKYPHLAVTNGCLVAGNELRVGFDSNLSSGFARFRASGPETSVKAGRLYWGMRADGAEVETFAVTGGAVFETTKTNGSFTANAGSVNGGVNVYTFAGAGSRARLRGGLRFSIGPADYGQPPVQIPNGCVAVETTGQYWVEETKGALPSLVVDDAGFAAARPGESVTLVACGTPCPDALSLLATNLTVCAAKDVWIGKAVVSADGRNLLYVAPNRPGLTILLR